MNEQATAHPASTFLLLTERVDRDGLAEQIGGALVIMRCHRCLRVAELRLADTSLERGQLRLWLRFCGRFLLRIELGLDGFHHFLGGFSLVFRRERDEQPHELEALDLHGEVDGL